MEFPKSVLEIAKKANGRFPNDVEKAVAWAGKNSRQRADFDDMLPSLIERGLREAIHDDRHRSTTRIKRSVASYGGPAKVVTGLSPSVLRVAQSVYLLYIAGKTLGEVLSEELLDIAQSERAIGNGYHFNARLCERLAPLVPKGKRVKDAVTESQLRAILREVKEECEKAPKMELAMAGH